MLVAPNVVSLAVAPAQHFAQVLHLAVTSDDLVAATRWASDSATIRRLGRIFLLPLGFVFVGVERPNVVEIIFEGPQGGTLEDEFCENAMY